VARPGKKDLLMGVIIVNDASLELEMAKDELLLEHV
jgi:hypothetical protein